MCFDQTTEQLYALSDSHSGQKRICHINMSDLSIFQSWDLSASQIGHVFVDNDLVYLGSEFQVGTIDRCYKLESSEWDSTWTPIIISNGGYITQITYDSLTSSLIQSDNSGIFIYRDCKE
jgi:hypothetical protein